jgi:hypothetical protein
MKCLVVVIDRRVCFILTFAKKKSSVVASDIIVFYVKMNAEN